MHFGNINKCTILQFMNSLYHLAPTYFDNVAIFRDLTQNFQ